MEMTNRPRRLRSGDTITAIEGVAVSNLDELNVLKNRFQAGDTVAVTVQGYTGGYGDDWDAFNREWSVDWAVLEGSVTGIQLTCEASEEPILRPASVSLANGGGPNVNNSLYNENALDGRQVYVQIDTAQDYQGETLKVALRFTRDLGDGEYASYWHVIQYAVQ